MEIPKLNVSPTDSYNAALLSQVRPPEWQNPAPAPRYDLVVIGGGTAGLVSAAGAAGLGARVALVERKLLGGDCLNFGCVPSKALLRAGRAAAAVHDASNYGINTAETQVNFQAVMERVRRLRAEISHHDSAERFKNMGVDVFFGNAKFLNGYSLDVNGATLRFKRAAICTGARAAVPAIEGLEDTGYLTNETVFELCEMPGRIVVLGAGPIGCELAQAFQRLGVAVTVLEMGARILPREDAEISATVAEALQKDGVEIICNARVVRVEKNGGGKHVFFERDGSLSSAVCDEMLLGAGRKPNIEGLNLEAAHVAYDNRGVIADDFLRTSNRRIFAAGDVCMAQQFTHAADAAARILIRNALFPLFPKARLGGLLIPRCTYTSPEIAHVGWTKGEALERGMAVDSISVPMSANDRAILDGATAGLLVVLLQKGKDKILGATLVSEHAGENIGVLALAMKRGAGLGALSGLILPYPTQGMAIKSAGDAYMRSKLTPGVAKLLRYLIALSR